MSSQRCSFEERVLLLQDAELTLDERLVVEAHLGICPACARTEAALERAGELLRGAPGQPLGAVERALATLPARSRVVRTLALAGAAAAAAAVVLLLPLSRDETQEPPSPVVTAKRSGPEERPSAPWSFRQAPPLATLAAQLGPAAPDYAERLDELARETERRGVAGSAALADLLLSSDPGTVACALDLAERVPSLHLARSLERLLESGEFADRAARLLGTIPAPGAVPALARALQGPAAGEAREALARIGGAHATRALEKELARRPDPATLDALVRAQPAAGARACVELDEGPLVASILHSRRELLLPELRHLLREADGGVAARAATLLGRARDEESIDLLSSRCRKQETGSASIAALIDIDTPRSLEAAFDAVRRGAPERGFAGKREAEADLLRRLRSGSRAERSLALRLLALCGGGATVEELRGGVEAGLRFDAVETLAAIGGPEAMAVLRGWLDGSGLNRALVDALARHPDEHAVKLLVDCLLDRRTERAAGVALARLPVGVVVPALLERFEESRDVRRVLARIAGADHGARAQSWKKWWDSRP